MAVQFLKNRNHSNKVIPEFGALRLGSPKKTNAKGNLIQGDNLDYFRMDFKPHYGDLSELFNRVIGDKPKRLEVELIGNTPDDVFPTWYKSGTATKLLHMCDGVTQHLHWDDSLGQHSHEPIPCVGGDAKGYQCKAQCKLHGELHITIPLFNQAVGKTGKFVINTTSFHNVSEIYPRLEFLFELRGSLMFMPAIIGRHKETKTYPTNDGRGKRELSLMYIEFDNELMRQFIERQNKALQMLPVVDVASTELTYRDNIPAQQVAQLPAVVKDEPEMGIDPEAIADWLADKLKTPITAPDVVQVFANNNFNYAEANPNMKLYAVALVLEAWNTDGAGNVLMDLVESQAQTLLPKSPDAVDYIMSVVLGTD